MERFFFSHGPALLGPLHSLGYIRGMGRESKAKAWRPARLGEGRESERWGHRRKGMKQAVGYDRKKIKISTYNVPQSPPLVGRSAAERLQCRVYRWTLWERDSCDEFT